MRKGIYALCLCQAALGVLGCQGYNSYAYLDGKFIDQSGQIAPVLLIPTDNGYATTATNFTWTTSTAALSYLVEFAAKADMTDIFLRANVTKSPYTIATADLMGIASLPEQIYYWRVTAKYPTKEEKSPIFKMALFDKDVIYVNLSSAASSEVGNQGAPFKTIQPALNFASTNGKSKVYVSKGSYPGTIQLMPNVTLQGGYDASANWTRNISANTTTISNNTLPSVVICTLSSGTTSGIDGFTIQNTLAIASTYGIKCEGAAPNISNNSIQSTVSQGHYGIYLFQSDANLSGNTIAITNPGAFNSTGIHLDTSSPKIANNSITMAAGTTNYGIFVSNSSAPSITGNFIDGGSGSASNIGIQDLSGSTTLISNNVIDMSGAAGSNTYGVYISSSPVISNNTINGSAAASNLVKGIRLTGTAAPSITNNIIFSKAGGSRYGVFEFSMNADPVSLQNNLIFDCPSGLYYDEVSNNRLTEANLNNVSQTTQVGPANGNLGPTTVANFAAVNFSGASDYHLTASTPASVRTGGRDTSQSICGLTGTTSCGNVLIDKDGLTRTVSYSMGAYEF